MVLCFYSWWQKTISSLKLYSNSLKLWKFRTKIYFIGHATSFIQSKEIKSFHAFSFFSSYWLPNWILLVLCSRGEARCQKLFIDTVTAMVNSSQLKAIQRKPAIQPRTNEKRKAEFVSQIVWRHKSTNKGFFIRFSLFLGFSPVCVDEGNLIHDFLFVRDEVMINNTSFCLKSSFKSFKNEWKQRKTRSQ